MPRKTASSSGGRRRSFFCKECGTRVRMPKDWSLPPSVRRHYWRRHPDIMRNDKGARG